MRTRRLLALLLMVGLVVAPGMGCSQPTATPPLVTEPTEKLPPEVVHDPESALQKYGRGGNRP